MKSPMFILAWGKNNKLLLRLHGLHALYIIHKDAHLGVTAIVIDGLHGDVPAEVRE